MEEDEPKTSHQLTVTPADKPLQISRAITTSIVVPAIVADAGDQAARRFLEFFAATIRNKNTRMAYYRAVCRFFAWCDEHQISGIADIEPLHVAAYIEAMQSGFEKPSVKQRCLRPNILDAAAHCTRFWKLSRKRHGTAPPWRTSRDPKTRGSVISILQRGAISILLLHAATA
jgi:site-specific recombinase XerD